PGHCMAVLAAHPEFSTTPREGKRTALTWGIYNRQNNVLAPTPEVFSFLDDVFDEVCALFPSKYIHAGGDECAPKWWNESAVAQEFMKKHNLPDAHALQTRFMHHVQRIINAHGKTMLGWSGGAEGMNPEGSVLHNWHSWDKMPKSRIDSTHQWINSGSTGLYFTSSEDSTQSEINPGRWPRSVKKVYDFELVPDSASVQAAQNLMGVEGCCWTEYCPTTWKVELQVFPRMAALAEKAWTGKNDDWEGFTRRLTHQLDLYDLWGIRYNDVVERTLIAPRQR
ncbi:MAG: family 20 glycosylhydrolase, partial [Bacteroidales bacterium]|nr:family 20 glycosylhydrolase [Bacteroidales bacterium]